MRGTSNIRNMSQSIIPSLATTGCAVCILFSIGVVIVVSLIPLYTSPNKLPVNPNLYRSKEITATFEVEANDTIQLNGRRRRDPGDLYQFVSGEFGETDKIDFGKTLASMLPSSIASDVSISSMSLGYEATSRRRRYALSKRATYPNHAIVVVVKFYIIYPSTCSYQCQINAGPTINSTIYAMSLTTFSFYNVQIFMNGLFYKIAPRIEFVRVIYISQIIPVLSSVTPSFHNVTVTLTTTTTTIPISNTPNILG